MAACGGPREWQGVLRLVFSPFFIFNKMTGFVFGFALALFFPQLRVYNNFLALFLGLFGFVFKARSFIFSNFSALFFKKGILFYFSPINSTQMTVFCFPASAFSDLRFICPCAPKPMAAKANPRTSRRTPGATC